jgi:UDP-N-acetylmuramate dehydrogenase
VSGRAFDQVEQALSSLGSLAQREYPLKDLTTYRLGGPAAVFVEARSRSDLHEVMKAQRLSGLPVLVIGRGSNLLVSDAGYPGIAVRLVEGFDQITAMEDRNQSELRVGAAVALPVVARRSAAMGLSGLEWAVGVPGSVGGAVRMNAGGHGSDLAHNLVVAEILDLESGQITERNATELGLRFRGSDLTDSELVLSVVLHLTPGDPTEANLQIAEIVRWRRKHQPGGQNCGSVFVNPIPGELSAGELIDRCGLRGVRRGGAVVAEKHANFIQADESATAADVYALMCHVRDEVEAATGIRLRSEVRVVGFEDQ